MPLVYFDASRLFLRAGRLSPSGIDRVVLAYARWLRAHPDVELVPVWSRLGYLSRLPLGRFDAILADAARKAAASLSRAVGGPTWEALTAALKHPEAASTTLRATRAPAHVIGEAAGLAAAALSALQRPFEVRLRPGALFINVNHYGLEHPSLLSRLRSAGVRPVVMIHDLIPIDFPEFCSPGAAERHGRRLDGALRHAETIITNSRSTADEVIRYAAEQGLGTPTLVPAPLGLETSFLQDAPPLEASPYFVCVGTIEPRKNLAFLLGVWRRLAERRGASTPPLVLVGRRGWENEAVIDQLERAPPILRHVHEVNNLPDQALAQLIRGATALLSPSFAEGFNLPVIEALSLGARVIASDIPVHRELAATATLVDPLDGPGWLAAVEGALVGGLPRRSFASPRWEAHFERVAAAIGLAPPPASP
jgi:glycosyltransferase involved in cell wall biosynthesis